MPIHLVRQTNARPALVGVGNALVRVFVLIRRITKLEYILVRPTGCGNSYGGRVMQTVRGTELNANWIQGLTSTSRPDKVPSQTPLLTLIMSDTMSASAQLAANETSDVPLLNPDKTHS